MTSGTEGYTTPAAPEPKPNPFARLVGVFFSPGQTFASIARKPDWIVPLAVLVVITLAGGILAAQKVNFNALAREAIESNPQMSKVPPERLDSSIRITGAMMKVAAYAGPGFVILGVIVAAGVLLLAFRLFGGEGTFGQAFSATLYAWYPHVIRGILGTIVIMSRKSLSVFDLQNPIRSNLGFLFDPVHRPLSWALASAVDLFSIWTLVLMVIGFSALSRLPKVRSAIIVVSLWVAVTMLTLIGPALQSMRSS